MPYARLMLCLAVLASAEALAQTPGGVAPKPVPPPTAPPLVPAPAQPEEPPPPGELIPREELPQLVPLEAFAPGRVILESLGGLGGGVGLGLATSLALLGLFSASGDCDDPDSLCALGAVIFAVPAVAVGVPLGVYLVGGPAGGQGEFLPALVGMLAGTGMGVLLALTDYGTLAALGFIVFPISGAVIGYELSQPDFVPAPRDSGPDEDGYASIHLTPVLGFTPRGGVMGGILARF